MASNAVAVTSVEAGKFLQGLSTTLEDYAIRDYSVTSFVKSAMIAIVNNPDLGKCLSTNEGKASLTQALRMAAGTGLSINPQEGKSALIPYGGKIQYQVMKNGLIELALESGKVEFITADTVRENDKFDLVKTADGDNYSYSPARKSRGEIDGFFATVKMKDGICHTKYMTLEEVQEHRKKFSPRTQMPEEGYGQKTILKKLLNNVHICSEINNAIGAENSGHDNPEPDLYTPPEKGTSAAELGAKIEEKRHEEAEVVDAEEEKQPTAGSEKSENKGSVI